LENEPNRTEEEDKSDEEQNTSLDPENMMVEVTIPENSAAGDKFTVQCPDNKYVEFVTPQNVVAGDKVHIVVPNVSEGESSVETTTVVESKEKTQPNASYGGAVAVTTVRKSCSYDLNLVFSLRILFFCIYFRVY
jgi:hypothetical protein